MKVNQQDESVRNEPDRELNVKQEAVAVELARGLTYEEAAKATGTGIATIKKWAATYPAFKRRVMALRGQMTDRVFGLIVDAMRDAVQTMRDLMATSNSELMRHKAAESMLAHGITAIEVKELRARIEALEEGR